MPNFARIEYGNKLVIEATAISQIVDLTYVVKVVWTGAEGTIDSD